MLMLTTFSTYSFRGLREKFTELVENEYHNLTHLYIISFIFGIVTYFHCFHLSTGKVIFFLLSSASVCLAKLLYYRFGRPRQSLLLTVFLSLILSFLCGSIVAYWQVYSKAHLSLKEPLYGKFTGVVEEIKPNAKGGRQLVVSVVKPKKYLYLKNIRVTSYTAEHVFVGDTIKFGAYLNPPTTAITPGGYDFAFHNYFKEISATGYANKKLEVITESLNRYSYAQNFRKEIYQRLTANMANDDANIAAALMIGETGGMDRELLQNMRFSGISHILCVSGLHMSLVAAICLLSLRVLLNLSDRIAYSCDVQMLSGVLTLICSFIYLLLTGQQIAATRAFIMTALMVIAFSIGRNVYPMRSLAVAAALILFLHPEYVLHPSFQLSFIAVISLISGFEFFKNYQNNKQGSHSGGLLGKLKLFLLSNIYSSTIASLATAPVVIYHFNIFSNYTLLANLVAIPLMGFYLMPMVIISLILIPVGLDAPALYLLSFGTSALKWIANYTVSLPNPTWYFGHISASSLVLFLLGFFWLSCLQTRIRLYGIVPIILSCIMMYYTPSPDILFSLNDKTFAVNKDDHLVIYGHKVSKYLRNYWSNWFGEKEAEYISSDITTQNHCIEISGRNIAIRYNNSSFSCSRPVLILNAYSTEDNNGSNIISEQELRELGTIAIYCKARSKCYIESSIANSI